MVPETAFSKAVFLSSSAGLRLAFAARHTPKQPCGLSRGGSRAPRRSGPALAAGSMARGGPEFDCGQPRRHPFTAEGGLDPAGPGSGWGGPFHPPDQRPGLQSMRKRPEPAAVFPCYVKTLGGNYVARKNFAGFLRSMEKFPEKDRAARLRPGYGGQATPGAGGYFRFCENGLTLFRKTSS